MAFPLHAGIFKLQSELDPLPLSQSFVCVTDRPLMAGLPGAVHYALASSLRRTQKVLSGLATQTTQRPPSPALTARGCAAANALGSGDGEEPLGAKAEQSGRRGNGSR